EERGDRERLKHQNRLKLASVKVARTNAWRAIGAGLAMFVLCGGIFGLVIFCAASGIDPPAWLRIFRGPIKYGIAVAIAGAIAGPIAIFKGFQKLRSLEKKEEKIRDSNRRAKSVGI